MAHGLEVGDEVLVRNRGGVVAGTIEATGAVRARVRLEDGRRVERPYDRIQSPEKPGGAAPVESVERLAAAARLRDLVIEALPADWQARSVANIPDGVAVDPPGLEAHGTWIIWVEDVL